MVKTCSIRPIVFCLGSVIAILLCSFQSHGQYDPDWTRNFRVGILTGFNIKAHFKTGGDFTVGANRAGATNSHGINHFYDDGYVRVDDTGNAQGYTTYWGYDNASQVAGDKLMMHSTTGYSAAEKSSSGEDSPYVGFDLAYGCSIWRGERMRVGWEFGFGLLPITISDRFETSGSVNQDSYSFDIPQATDGSGPIHIPSAPYPGTPSGYDQPLLGDSATYAGSSPTNGTISGTRTLDVTLYSFRLGPTLFWDVNDSFGLMFSAGPAVGLISGSYHYDDTLAIASGSPHNKGSFSATDIVFGGYVNTTLTYHATENGDFYVSAQYMPLGSSTFSKGGREAKLDLSGAIYLSAGINWPF